MEWTRGKCIGKGAFGTVHLAVDRATGRAFAVKSVDARGGAPAAAMACLESEIRILKTLSSPCVVAYLGDDATAASRNLHMELVQGGTAADAAAATGGLSEREARRVLRRVAAALRYLHDVAEVVHGDVKGRNVLLGGDGGAKLADFGAARLMSEPAPRGPRGTPAWMAPEVARGGASTPASDVWSLGCTAVELLAGKRPWSEIGGGLEVGELLLRVGFGGRQPELPARLSDPCRDFFDRCLRHDAGERWTCEQLLRHPFLAADDDVGEPEMSPRAVLDWAASDSDSDASFDCSEADIEEEHEVMARAKVRIAELAPDMPRTSRARELDEWPTWSSDTWVPLPGHEMSTNVPSGPSPSDAATVDDAGNGGGAGDGAVVSGSFCCVNRLACCDDRCRNQRSWSGVDRPGSPPLAVVSPLVSCIFSHLIQSKILFELSVSIFFLQLLVHASFVALTLDFAANWVSDPAEVGWSKGRSFVLGACLQHLHRVHNFLLHCLKV
ncbi:mitogen-activated protein kinase kinase kinase 18-like [Lolium rigidum]|uniref:mitogen-activated protein kinase kinase kinase 18-like n=1 Tax=Lolium rigidum TaxID=89674 RepID=UPI001F5C0AC6|nr:mitogen-activated protein kinase kinase kinase 18-like [Lolium rigidum]